MPAPVFLHLDPPHPSMLEDDELLKRCRVTFGRAHGPGGQHRNKVETAARIVHGPTGLDAQAGERRHQQQNRSMAVRRLRLRLALRVRTGLDPFHYQPSPGWVARRQGKQISVNPHHRDYPALLAEALDVVVAMRFDVAGAAGVMGISMSQVAKLVRHDKHAFAMMNEGRKARGLPALK